MRARVRHARRSERHEGEALRLAHAQARGDARRGDRRNAAPRCGRRAGCVSSCSASRLCCALRDRVVEAGEVRRQHDVEHQQREHADQADETRTMSCSERATLRAIARAASRRATMRGLGMRGCRSSVAAAIIESSWPSVARRAVLRCASGDCRAISASLGRERVSGEDVEALVVAKRLLDDAVFERVKTDRDDAARRRAGVRWLRRDRRAARRARR